MSLSSCLFNWSNSDCVLKSKLACELLRIEVKRAIFWFFLGKLTGIATTPANKQPKNPVINSNPEGYANKTRSPGNRMDWRLLAIACASRNNSP